MSLQQHEYVPAPLRKPHDNYAAMVLRKCWDRPNRRNEHFIACVVGREGIGKSQTCLKIASLLDPKFDASQVFFKIEDFLKLLRDDNFREGGAYILDEAGVAFGNRTWQDRSQVLANQALQLIRDHNVILLFSLPRLGELDSQTQGRLHALYEITDKEDGDHVAGKWKWIDPDRSGVTGKIYRKYPRTQMGERVKSIGFAPPPESLVEPYEEQKDSYQEEVYAEAIEKLSDEADDDGDGTENDPSDIAETILEEEGIRRYIKEVNNGAQTIIDKGLIKSEHDIGSRKAKQVKSKLADKVEIDVM